MKKSFLQHAASRALMGATALVLAVAAHAQPAKKPAGPAGVVTFDVHAEGEVLHLLAGYGSKRPANITLWYRRSADGGSTWSEPVRVNREGEAVMAPHPGENPQIAAAGGRLIAAWTGPDPDGGRAGPIATAVSTDGGKTWQRGPNPADDGSNRYHALVELESANGALHMVWLHQYEDRQALHYAASADGGRSWKSNRLLSPETCNCCWNRIAVLPDNSVRVLFRGGAPRDMMLVGSADGAAWRYFGQVGRFNWDFPGCPHVGGALAVAANGKALHALVWTGQEKAVGLYHLASADGGASWSAPRRIGGEQARDSDLAASADGALTAVWDAADGKGTAIYRARSRDGGASWSAPEPLSAADGYATHPRVLPAKQGPAAFWLESKAGQAPQLKVNGREIAIPASAPVAAATGGNGATLADAHAGHHRQ